MHGEMKANVRKRLLLLMNSIKFFYVNPCNDI